MRKYPFSSLQEVARHTKGREVVLFGAGNIAAKTLRRIGSTCSYIADNNPNLWNTQQLGVHVHDPDALLRCTIKPFVIICTTSFMEVSEQLSGMGFTPARDFLVTPVLNDLRIIAELEQHKARLLFTSGLPPADDPSSGGGIYELTLDGEWSYRKVHSGNCHALMKFGENFITVDDDIGIVEFDRDYRMIRSRPLPPASRGHGVAYCEVTGRFFVACSEADRIRIFDRDLRPAGEIALSAKSSHSGEAAHHMNDLRVIGGSLYASMFSYTGNWKKDIFDGVVLEFDIESGQVVGPVIRDLWMPHNVDYIDGSLVVLDSLRGRLLKNNAQPVGEFPAFTRGLAHDGIYYYIGQSRNRNYSRNIGLSKNISIDTAIIVFDEYTKVSRTLQLPSRLSEIHAIMVL